MREVNQFFCRKQDLELDVFPGLNQVCMVQSYLPIVVISRLRRGFGVVGSYWGFFED